MNGVVEYCFSGMRFKVRLDGENTAIGFNLLGVKTMANDKNQPELLEFSNEALAFAKSVLFQRDVVVEPDFADKRGSFFGTVTMSNKKDFGLLLVQEGLA
jgi:endonuclease YncB( thermonuclease family)